MVIRCGYAAEHPSHNNYFVEIDGYPHGLIFPHYETKVQDQQTCIDLIKKCSDILEQYTGTEELDTKDKAYLEGYCTVKNINEIAGMLHALSIILSKNKYPAVIELN